MESYIADVINPFAKIQAEDNEREQIYNLFNRNGELINRFKERSHQFIWGTRGSGKSTLLRFFEPYCQFKEHGGWEKYLSKADSFVSFYCPIPRGIVNISDFEMSASPSKDIIYSHFFNMLFTESIITALKEQLFVVEKNESFYNEFYDFFTTLFDRYDSIAADTSQKVQHLEISPVEKILILIENEKKHALSFCSHYGQKKEYQYYEGSLTNYGNFILPFIKHIRRIYKLPVPIFISIDDAGFLMENEQEQINSWVSNRNKDDLIVKIASDPLEYKTFSTVDRKSIRRIHDYDDIFLDVRSSSTLKDSSESLLNIAERRLKYYYLNPITINELLPSDDTQDQLIEEAKKNLELYVAQNEDIKDKNRYVSRYTMQEFYKILSEKREKGRVRVFRNLAGIEDLINLSDHNARTFLCLCNSIFMEKYPNSTCSTKVGYVKSTVNLERISYDIQNRGILKFSQEEASYISKYKTDYAPELISKLQIFIDSIGTLFRGKLLDFDDKEYGVTGFSTDFSLLEESEKAVIRIAVECGFLLKYSYTSKDAFAKIDSYNLSKKLFPYFSLEPKPYSGRIYLKYGIIKKAFYNTKEFIKNYRDYKNETDTNVQQLTLFEEGIIDEDRQNDYSELF